MKQNFKTSIIKKPPSSSFSPSSILNYLFMSTVNTAARTLNSFVQSSSSPNPMSWKLTDHFRYAGMLLIWFTLWVLRVLMDYVPLSFVPSPLLDGLASSIGLASSHDHHSTSFYGGDPLSSSSTSPSMDLVLHQGYGGSGGNNYYYDESIDISDQRGGGSSSSKSIGRALSHIFTLMNEIPATSRKYQFAVSMADRIVDENVREGHAALQEVNRMALSYAFSRTYNMLYRSLQDNNQANVMDHDTGTGLFRSLPLGSYMESGLRFCLNSFTPFGLGGVLLDSFTSKKVKKPVTPGGGYYDEEERILAAEKLAQELLWITNKLRACGAVDEALGQWSLASGLASLSFSSHHRVQSLIVKITIILLGELARGAGHHKESLLVEAPREVKYRLLLLWIPLLCYANGGLSYPVLTGIEKAETERVIDQVISTLPASDQEIILTNWLQDYTNSSSDWPNLQRSYDQWCRSSRNNILLLTKE